MFSETYYQPFPYQVPYRWLVVLSFPFGMLTGAAAGLIGVGGVEFRITFLLAAYRNRVKTAAGYLKHTLHPYFLPP